MQAIPMSTQQQQQQPYPGTMAVSLGGPANSRFGHRHWLFRLGFVGMIPAALLFAAGFASPTWISVRHGLQLMRKSGLWAICNEYYEYCVGYTGNADISYPDWLDAVRALEVVALICLTLSLGTVLYQDFCKTPPPLDNRAAEILGVFAGVLGLAGAAVFGGKMKSKHKDETADRIGWGFWLAVSGLILAILCSLLMALNRARPAECTNWSREGLPAYAVRPPARAPGAVMIPMQPVAPGHGYHPCPLYPADVAAAPVATEAQGTPDASQVPSK